MADRELIAAILTAGMLPTLDVPQSRVRARNVPVTRAEREVIQSAVDHAFGLYRLVLNGLGVDPSATMTEPDTETRPPAVALRNGAVSQHLPGVVDGMKPSGQMPDEGTISVSRPPYPTAFATPPTLPRSEESGDDRGPLAPALRNG